MANPGHALPINDEAHVRDALSRFNQTTFEDEAARHTDRMRLLNATKTGFVTFLLADIEDSTGLVGRLTVSN